MPHSVGTDVAALAASHIAASTGQSGRNVAVACRRQTITDCGSEHRNSDSGGLALSKANHMAAAFESKLSRRTLGCDVTTKSVGVPVSAMARSDAASTA